MEHLKQQNTIYRKKTTQSHPSMTLGSSKKQQQKSSSNTSNVPLMKLTGDSPAMPVIFTFIQSPLGRLRWKMLILVLFTWTASTT
jgi:hypothetical protein